MDLRSLRYFTVVYENGSISAAAKHCYIAQPSISNAIRQLEDKLQVPLFERYARGVKPTGQGKELYPLAKKLLGEAKAMETLFVDGPDCVPFRLGLSRALGVERMSRLLQQLTSAVDGLELTLVEPDASSDARIISESLLEANECFQPIWRDQYLLALPVGHPLSLQSTIPLRDLDQLAFISRTSCEIQRQLFYAMEKLGLRSHIRAKIQTVEYALGLVNAGVGCTLLPDLPPLLARQDICFRPIGGIELKRTIGLAYQSEQPTDNANEAVMATLKQVCLAHRATPG